MDIIVIIILCILLLISYLFDVTSAKTKIPSVILMILMGMILQQIKNAIGLKVPDLNNILPIIGTVGLVLIVLEGAMELEMDKSKLRLVFKSFLGAIVPMIVLAVVLALIFSAFSSNTFVESLTNAIPLCIISSAVAIPSVRNLKAASKEFIIYESSFSDILGVLFFNYISLNSSYDISSFGRFSLQILTVLIITIIATILLSFFLKNSQQHIKFIPIILILILIYAICELFHLPALIFILLFGLYLGNLHQFIKYQWAQKIQIDSLIKESIRFKELITEITFLVRSLFFLLFGFLIQTSEILDLRSLLWAIIVIILIYLIRAVTLKLLKLQLNPILFLAPRGLITILLFLSIAPEQSISIVNKSLIVQVVVLSVLIMMIGPMIMNKRQKATSLVTDTNIEEEQQITEPKEDIDNQNKDLIDTEDENNDKSDESEDLLT